MSNDPPRAGRIAGLTPLLIATLAVLVAAIALTVGGASTVIVVLIWLATAMVAGATLAVATRRP